MSNSNSNEYVMINISSSFEPRTNEVWIKHVDDEKGDFTLISPMRYGVHYVVKHSGNFLYKLTNEHDGINYKLIKIQLPSKYLLLSTPTETSNIKKKDNELEVIKQEKIALPGERSVVLPNSPHFEKRSDSIIKQEENAISLLEPSELASTNYDAKIIGFEINKHFLILIEERNQVEQIKVLNLKTDKWKTYTHPEEFYHITLIDNNTYSTQYLRYTLHTPHWPDQTNELNMSMGKKMTLQNQHINGFNPENYQTERLVVGD